jgi:methyltransferase (TIGR00027 family)
VTDQAGKHEGSRTAGYTCFSRACASREPDERFRGPDHMAEVLLPWGAKLVLNIPLLRRLFVRRVAPPGIYEYVLARTKVMDQVFIEALEERFAQIVLLGAGFDTRALRFQSRNQGTLVFELDVPETQRPKVDILSRKGTTLPDELVLVPIDFEQESLPDALFAAGYEAGQKSLFIGEGLIMYLSPEAVNSTFEFIHGSTLPGSVVAFDYVRASVLRRENKFYGEKQIFDTVSAAGEGWTFSLEDETIEDFLAQRGFKLASLHTPVDLERDYLTADDGTLFGRINGTHCLVVASVC